MTSKKLPIIFDGLGLVEGHFSGVGQYILGLLQGLDEIIENAKNKQESFHRVKVIVPYNTIGRFKSFNFKHIEYIVAPISFRLMGAMWLKNRLPPIDLLFGKGFYIFPRFVSMPLFFSKSAIVIYDISFELYKQFSDERNAQFLSSAVSRSIQSTNHIITISQNAKREIIDFYKIKPDMVTVATPATNPSSLYRRSAEEIEDIKKKYNIKGKYILALSNLEPRKNLDMLVKTYCKLPEAIRTEYSLLLVGVSGWKTDKLFSDIVRRVKDGYNIIRPSQYVSDIDKAAIISGASVLVYPSHYEGFGMPPLEALACGTPIITSNNSSLPEVVGKAGIMIDSKNEVKLKEAVLSVLGDPNIAKRTLTEGPQRSRLFSWKRSAELVIEMVDNLS
jgi:glycosyltransferase involved in cell wall biosynthesis